MRLLALGVFAAAVLVSTPGAAQDSDSLTWARANSCELIRSYIQRYPNGRHIAEARQQLTARRCPDPNRTATTPTQTPPQGDQCVQARTDWQAVQHDSLAVVRAYREGLPRACGVWRERANERIATLEQRERDTAVAQERVRLEQQEREARDARIAQRISEALQPHIRRSEGMMPALDALNIWGVYATSPSDCQGALVGFHRETFNSERGEIALSVEGNTVVFVNLVSVATNMERNLRADPHYVLSLDERGGSARTYRFSLDTVRSVYRDGGGNTFRRCRNR